VEDPELEAIRTEMANTATTASKTVIGKKNATKECETTNPVEMHKGVCTGPEFTEWTKTVKLKR
jgi:hypothetical protein